MSLDSFRRALGVRHAEMAACTRARLLGASRDEALLDELDADLFSRLATAEAVSLFHEGDGGGARTHGSVASARSRLAIVLEEGILARLRPLDRAIESALARGRREEVEELDDERRKQLAEEGSRSFAPVSNEASRPVDALTRESVTENSPRALAAEVRGEVATAMAASARKFLGESAGVAEHAADLARAYGGARESGTDGGASRSRQGRGAGAPILATDPLMDVVEAWCGHAPDFPAALIVPALRELGADLDLDPGAGLTIVAHAEASGPWSLEIDPPGEVLLVLPAAGGFDAFTSALDAWGVALSARLRTPSLPEEHRLRADRALASALGAIAATLAPEHAHLRREPLPPRRRSLAWEIASARLAAALLLDRDGLLSGSRPDRRGTGAALEEASLGRVREAGPERPRRPIFEALDRFRGHLLAPHLRDRLRTRFGNLWYRERRAGRFLREMTEPGGSVLTSEVLAGLSLPVPSAESLVDSWRDEIKRLR